MTTSCAAIGVAARGVQPAAVSMSVRPEPPRQLAQATRPCTLCFGWHAAMAGEQNARAPAGEETIEEREGEEDVEVEEPEEEEGDDEEGDGAVDGAMPPDVAPFPPLPPPPLPPPAAAPAGGGGGALLGGVAPPGGAAPLAPAPVVGIGGVMLAVAGIGAFASARSLALEEGSETCDRGNM